QRARRPAARERERGREPDAGRAAGDEDRLAAVVRDHAEGLAAFAVTVWWSMSTRPSMFVSLASSERGIFTLISRIELDTTSTMSRLLAPRSFIERCGSTFSGLRPSTASQRCLMTTAWI